MNNRGLRGLRAVSFAAAALALALVGAACSSAQQPTPIYLVPTPTPSAATPVPATSAPTPTPQITPAATFTPWPSASPTPTPGPTSAHTAAPTPTVSAGPTSPAASCTGKPTNQSWFLEAANNVKITVYCATRLAAGWSLAISPQTSWASNKSGGTVLIYYSYHSTATRLEVCEGTFASTLCAGNTGSVGAASFGGLSGELDSTSDGFAIRVAPGTNHAYTLVGHNVSQATLVGIGANMTIVPRT